MSNKRYDLVSPGGSLASHKAAKLLYVSTAKYGLSLIHISEPTRRS